MKIAIAAAVLLAGAASAQEADQPRLTAEQHQKLNALADQVKTALADGDLARANELASNLMIGIFEIRRAAEPTAQQKLERPERSNEPRSIYRLSRMAMTACQAGDLEKAFVYGNEVLAGAKNPRDSYYGHATFYGNTALGLVALKRDKDIASAKRYLLLAANTPGSPSLVSFGPDMILAKELLAAGEREAVLQFFELCRKFWKLGGERLDEWTATVKGGGVPKFRGNLRYS